MAEASAVSMENLQIDALICFNGYPLSIVETHLNEQEMAELNTEGDDIFHIISSTSKQQNDIKYINSLIRQFRITLITKFDYLEKIVFRLKFEKAADAHIVRFIFNKGRDLNHLLTESKSVTGV